MMIEGPRAPPGGGESNALCNALWHGTSSEVREVDAKERTCIASPYHGTDNYEGHKHEMYELVPTIPVIASVKCKLLQQVTA